MDVAVQHEPGAMEQAVVDKAYMAQLVEVQQMRGAAGGKEFHKLLTQEEVKEEEPKVKGQHPNNYCFQIYLLVLLALQHDTFRGS